MAWAGGGGQQPTGSQTTYNAISAYAAPYVNSMLGQGAALTSQPYQAYPGQQNANFTGLQNQSFTGVGNLNVAPQTGQATTAAGQATQNLLGTSYNPNQATTQQFTDPGVAASYMNPYLTQYLAPQLQALQQQQGIQGQQLQSQATQSGAFGNSRFGLQQGLQNQANQLATSNLLGQGYNTAYNTAQQQFNADQARNLQAQGMNIGQQQFGANLGLQGNQAALTGANTLGNLGQNQYAQQTGILGLQNAYGTQQQQQQQNILNTQYQNFQNQLNYPYQQLSFMQGLLSGLPISQSTTQVYQSPGAQLAQAAGLGLGAASLGKSLTSKEGGLMEAFKHGGEVRRFNGDIESVPTDPMSPSNIRALIANMTTQELQQERQTLLNRQDPQGKLELAIVDERLGIVEQPSNPQQPMNTAIPQGSIANAVTPDMADQMVQTAAKGGIMGFADGELASLPEKKQSTFGSIFDALGGNALATFLSENAAKEHMQNMAESQTPGFFEKLTPTERANRLQAARNIANVNQGLGGKYGENLSNEERAKLESIRASQNNLPTQNLPTQELPTQEIPDTSTAKTPINPFEKTPTEQGHITQAVQHVAAMTNKNPADLMDLANKNYDMFKAHSADQIKSLSDFVESQKPKDTKDRDFYEALAKYGFSVAAEASKPGGTALKAFAAASPALADSLAASRKARQDLQDNYNKLRMNQAQYEISLNKGDMQAATALAAQQRALESQQDQLNALMDYHNKALAIESQKVAKMGEANNIPVLKITKTIMDAHPGMNFDTALKQATSVTTAGAGLRTDNAARTSLFNATQKLKDKYLAPVANLPKDSKLYKTAKENYQNEVNSTINQHKQIFGDFDTSGIADDVPSINLNQWGQPKVKGGS